MLPVYELKIGDSLEDEFQVYAVAGVDKPATGVDFFAFSEQVSVMNFAEINEDERIVIGAAMIPNMLIYRCEKDDKGNIVKEYNVFYTKETIANIAVKFFEKGFQKNFNLMHDPNQQKDGVVFFQSFIKDTAKGIEGMKGNYSEGTWFLGGKFNNDEVWAKVKSGEIKGWSVEGYFKMHVQEMSDEQAVEELKKMMNGKCEG